MSFQCTGICLVCDRPGLPAWLVSRKATKAPISKDEIHAREIIVMHLAEGQAPASYFGSARSLEGRIAKIHKLFPDAIVPDRGESIVIETGSHAMHAAD